MLRLSCSKLECSSWICLRQVRISLKVQGYVKMPLHL